MYVTPTRGGDLEGTLGSPEKIIIIPMTEEEAINKYIEDDIRAFELMNSESSEVPSAAAMEDNPCMNNSDGYQFTDKDAYGILKNTMDSLDQLETKHSEQPNQTSLTNGGKNAIQQQSFSTIPISYLNEQGSVNSVEPSHRRQGTEEIANHGAQITINKDELSNLTPGTVLSQKVNVIVGASGSGDIAYYADGGAGAKQGVDGAALEDKGLAFAGHTLTSQSVAEPRNLLSNPHTAIGQGLEQITSLPSQNSYSDGRDWEDVRPGTERQRLKNGQGS